MNLHYVLIQRDVLECFLIMCLYSTEIIFKLFCKKKKKLQKFPCEYGIIVIYTGNDIFLCQNENKKRGGGIYYYYYYYYLFISQNSIKRQNTKMVNKHMVTKKLQCR